MFSSRPNPELEVELQPKPLKLTRGEFFGEVALVYHRERSASVVALSRSELLELEARDLNRLFETKPELKSCILAEAERRMSRTPLEPAHKPTTETAQNADPSTPV